MMTLNKHEHKRAKAKFIDNNGIPPTIHEEIEKEGSGGSIFRDQDMVNTPAKISDNDDEVEEFKISD